MGVFVCVCMCARACMPVCVRVYVCVFPHALAPNELVGRSFSSRANRGQQKNSK